MIKAGLLFFATALAEIIGCLLPYLWLRKDGSPWLLTLHPAVSGRGYSSPATTTCKGNTSTITEQYNKNT